MHDTGEKVVLGHRIPAGGGQDDGERVLAILTHHPATARFIATKLVRRFVADTPPPPLVERVAATYLSTDGDIRAMLRTIVAAPEFVSSEAYRAKVKTPFEFVASAVRALGATVDAQGAFDLARASAEIGEPLYQAQPPTGYPDRAEAWVNSGALLARMNFALALARSRYPRVAVDPGSLVTGADPRSPDAVLDRLLAALVAVFQRGAVDGLSMVVPHGDPAYAAARQTIALRPPKRGEADRAVDLDGFFALHPGLAPLVPLWESRSLAIVHACGSPDTTRAPRSASRCARSPSSSRRISGSRSPSPTCRGGTPTSARVPSKASSRPGCASSAGRSPPSRRISATGWPTSSSSPCPSSGARSWRTATAAPTTATRPRCSPWAAASAGAVSTGAGRGSRASSASRGATSR